MLARIFSEIFRRDRAQQHSAPASAVPSDEVILEASAALRRGDPAAAAAKFRQALLRDPRCTEAWFGLGTAYQRAGDLRRAHLYLRTALSLSPNDASLLNELGLVELEFGNAFEAEAVFEQALNADPSHPQAWNNLGMALGARGQLTQAKRCFQRAISLKPDFYMALCNLGLASGQLELPGEALAALRRATNLREHEPTAWLNLGLLLKDQGLLDEALVALQSALAAAPDAASVLTAIADLQLKRGAPRACESAALQALHIAPSDAEAGLALAHLRLAEGDFEAGWPLYEARLTSRSGTLQRYAAAPWDGSALDGRPVLVYREQGLGDEIMFASMLPDLLQRVAACRLVCEPRLKSLLSRSFAAAEVMIEPEAMRAPARNGEVAVAIGSLGTLYRRARAAFPPHHGYLQPDPAALAAARARLSARNGPHIGISWRGGLDKTGRAVRSLTAEALAPLIRARPAHWISLQRDAAAGEIEGLEAATGVAITRWEGVGSDLEATAALFTGLDLIITVCSTVVHLAGALGRATWVLTPFAPAWRYQLQGDSMPWYPAVRLFRQPHPGDWDVVLARVASTLQAHRP